jgi:hypothetical protein
MLTGAAKLAGIAGLLAKTAMVGAAGVGGYAVGNLLNESIEGTEFSAALDRILAPLFSAVSGKSLEAPGMSQPIGPEAPPEIVQRTRDATKNQALQNRAMHERTSQIGPQSPTARPAAPQRVDVRVQVDVDTKNKDLKATPRPGRGGAQ